MNAETIKDFLATLENYVERIASRLEQLGWRAQDAGSMAVEIKALDYAAAQTGLASQALSQAVDNLFTTLKTSPGAETLLNRLGVATRNNSGELNGANAIFTGVSNTLAGLPGTQADDYARQLGISPQMLAAMQRGLGEYTAGYQQMVQTLGVNLDAATAGAGRFMNAQRRFDQIVELLQEKSSSRLTQGLSDSFNRLSERLLQNSPGVERSLNLTVDMLLKLADVGERIVTRLIQAASDLSGWWNSLENGTQQLIASLTGVAGAWVLFNSAFLLSPVGLITAFSLAIMALYDDYQTWLEGGQTFIDWEKWRPAIEDARAAIGWLTDALVSLNQGTVNWQESFQTLSDFLTGNWSPNMIRAVDRVKSYLNGFFSDVANKLANSPLWWGLQKLHIMSEKDTQEMVNAMGSWFAPDVKTDQNPDFSLNPAFSGANYRALNNLLDPRTVNLMINATDPAVNGRVPWGSELSPLQQGQSVDFQQETNIYRQGTGDPQQAADSVVNSQFDVNSLLVQKMRRIPS